MQDHHTTTPSGVTTKMVLPRGEQGILPRGSQTFKAPQAFKGPHEAFILMIFYLYGLHLHAVSHFPALSGLNQ